jgi:hypothetical protein
MPLEVLGTAMRKRSVGHCKRRVKTHRPQPPSFFLLRIRYLMISTLCSSLSVRPVTYSPMTSPGMRKSGPPYSPEKCPSDDWSVR